MVEHIFQNTSDMLDSSNSKNSSTTDQVPKGLCAMKVAPTEKDTKTPDSPSVGSISVITTSQSESTGENNHPDNQEDEVIKSKRNNKNILFLGYILGSICYAGVHMFPSVFNFFL